MSSISASSVSQGICWECKKEVIAPEIEVVERVQRTFHQICLKKVILDQEITEIREGKDLVRTFKYTVCLLGVFSAFTGSLSFPVAGVAAYICLDAFESNLSQGLRNLESKKTLLQGDELV